MWVTSQKFFVDEQFFYEKRVARTKGIRTNTSKYEQFAACLVRGSLDEERFFDRVHSLLQLAATAEG